MGHLGVQKCVYIRYKGAFKGRALVQFVGNMPISFINEHGLNVCKIKYNRQTITLFLNPSEEFGNIYISRNTYLCIVKLLIEFMDYTGIVENKGLKHEFQNTGKCYREKEPKKKNKVKHSKWKKNYPDTVPGFKIPGYRRNVGLWS